MLVPEPLQKLFNNFPLVDYPPIPNSTPAINTKLEENRYYFTGDDSNEAIFTLAVFNIAKVNGKYIPTDPFGLSYGLILSKKNNLKFPTPSAHTNKSRKAHSIMKLSYSASPDKTLPLMIEDDLETKTRDLRVLAQLETEVNARLGPEDQFINQLIDTELFDLWLLCIWYESERIDLGLVFGLELVGLTKLHLFETMPEWKHFKTRHPKLGPTLYHQKLADVKKILGLVGETGNEIVQMKVYGFVVHVKEFLGETKLGEIVSPELTRQATEYLQTV